MWTQTYPFLFEMLFELLLLLMAHLLQRHIIDRGMSFSSKVAQWSPEAVTHCKQIMAHPFLCKGWCKERSGSKCLKFLD